MQGGKNPTVSQKKVLARLGLNPNEWLIARWNLNNVVLRHKVTQEIRNISLEAD